MELGQSTGRAQGNKKQTNRQTKLSTILTFEKNMKTVPPSQI
jgi:hypothetical protein